MRQFNAFEMYSVYPVRMLRVWTEDCNNDFTSKALFSQDDFL